MAASPQIRRGAALAALAALLFGMTAPLLKRASAGAGPLLAGSLLYLGAALGAGLLATLRRQPGGPAATRPRALVRLAAVALVGGAIAPTLLVLGLQRTDAATASLLLALEAPFTLALARLVLREFIGPRVTAAALAIVAGGVVLLGGSLGAPAALSGAVLVAAAALAWAVDNLLSRPLADHDPLDVVALKGILGGACSGAVGLALGERVPGLRAAGALLALGAVGYGISLQLYLRSQRVVGAARTASIFASAPFFGAAIAFAFGTPWPGVAFPVAALLVGVGLWLHLSEHHAHRHTHGPIEHEHLHRHDDGHHTHRHDPMPAGAHSHPHRHEALTHEHEHSEDLHHLHRH
jgi:drug/metabolite transporter (DMT)-like permease